MLEWSHVPVCYPSVLVSKAYWSQVLHSRSVACRGDAARTDCQLTCIRDYVAVENSPYSCSQPPCPAWEGSTVHKVGGTPLYGTFVGLCC